MTRLFLLGAVSACLIVACAAPSDSDDALDSTNEELRRCASGPMLRGIDVSKWQQNVDWARVKGSGKAFAYARVSDGLKYPDSFFGSNWRGMKAAGLIRGAYLFFRASQDSGQQADLLIRAIDDAGGLEVGDLPPMLDFETADGMSASTAAARAQKWLDIIEAHYGFRPIVYSGNNMNAVTGSHFSTYALMVPNYGATCPDVPPGWSSWAIWQDSQTGRCPGVSGDVDTDWFNGDLAALKRLTFHGGI